MSMELSTNTGGRCNGHRGWGWGDIGKGGEGEISRDVVVEYETAGLENTVYVVNTHTLLNELYREFIVRYNTPPRTHTNTTTYKHHRISNYLITIKNQFFKRKLYDS